MRPNNKERLRLLQRLDWTLLLSMLGLIIVGVAFIYSAGFQPDAGEQAHTMHQRQIMWVVVGLGSFIALATFDYRKFADNGGILYFAAIVLLIAVFPLGTQINGAYRWFNVFGMYLQPSEFAKLATLIALSVYLSRPGRTPRDPHTLMVAMGLILLPFALIAAEPDLGTASVLIAIAGVTLIAAGLSLRVMGLLSAIGVFVVSPISWLWLLDEYQKDRLRVLFNPSSDPYGAGWNILQSKLAVGSGGVLGKGFLEGTQNILGYLPRGVAATDFIFSVIAEEMGFAGSMLVLVLFSALLLSIARAALRAPDRLGRYLCLGVLGMMFAHIFVNIGMTIGRMPVTGLPLPLISYGGSFMLSTMMALGLTQSVYSRRNER